VPPKLMFFGLFASEIAEPFLTSTQYIFTKQKRPLHIGSRKHKKADRQVRFSKVIRA